MPGKQHKLTVEEVNEEKVREGHKTNSLNTFFSSKGLKGLNNKNSIFNEENEISFSGFKTAIIQLNLLVRTISRITRRNYRQLKEKN